MTPRTKIRLPLPEAYFLTFCYVPISQEANAHLHPSNSPPPTLYGGMVCVSCRASLPEKNFDLAWIDRNFPEYPDQLTWFWSWPNCMHKTRVPRHRSGMSAICLSLSPRVSSLILKGAECSQIFTKLISDSLAPSRGPQCENTYKSF